MSIKDMDEEAIRAELAVCEAEPWEAYFTAHGEGMIVPSRMPYPSSRIADVSTSPDDYGKANTLAIAAARTGYPDAMREILRLRAEKAKGRECPCYECSPLWGELEKAEARLGDCREERDEALAQCAVMRAALEKAQVFLWPLATWGKGGKAQGRATEAHDAAVAALAPGAGAALLAAIRRVLDCPPEDDHEAQTALRELIGGGQ